MKQPLPSLKSFVPKAREQVPSHASCIYSFLMVEGNAKRMFMHQFTKTGDRPTNSVEAYIQEAGRTDCDCVPSQTILINKSNIHTQREYK